MSNQITLNPILSFPEVLQSHKPREMFEMRLIKLLKVRLVEDIETFNPPFIKRMKQASAEIKKGDFITLEELVKIDE